METSEAVQEVENAKAPPARRGRNIVICLDGTNNQFGEINTNVVRVVQLLDQTPDRQRIYYDPGVGTLAEPGVYGSAKKWISKIAGLAFGAGLDWKVQEAYSYLMDFWEAGDHVYIFGFSRGSYAARVLAGLLYTVGLLPRGSYNMVPYAVRLYREVRSERSKGQPGEWAAICKAFRWTFARPTSDDDQERHFPVHFLGVWDTVSSVGWVWDPATYPYTARNPGVVIIRHAISVNERRWFFRQNTMKQADPGTLVQPAPEQDLLEVWFAGVHSDVGGGYEPLLKGKPAELWREPFTWMIAEAKRAGLRLDEQRLEQVLGEPPKDPRPWSDVAHESLTRLWWLAEFFPKQVWDSKTKKKKWSVGLGRNRIIPAGALIHRSVLQRIREESLEYVPLKLSGRFIQEVRELKEAPEFLKYEP